MSEEEIRLRRSQRLREKAEARTEHPQNVSRGNLSQVTSRKWSAISARASNVSSKALSEVSSKASSKALSVISRNVSSKAVSEVSSKVSSKALSVFSRKVSSKTLSEVSSKVSSKALLEVSSKVSSKASEFSRKTPAKVLSDLVSSKPPSASSRESSASSEKSLSSTSSRRMVIESEIEKTELELKEIRLQKQLMDLNRRLDNEKGRSVESFGTQSFYRDRSNVKDWLSSTLSQTQHSDTSNNNTLSHSALKRYRKTEDKIDTHQNSHQKFELQMSQMLARQSLQKDLPKFSGDPVEWPNFIAQFQSSTKICGYTEEENQCRLQRALTGQARKAVQSLLILPQNVGKIIKILENRFGRPEHIITLLLEKVGKQNPVRQDKLESFVEFADEVQNLIATIECLQQEDHLRNPILLRELVKKLPISQQLSWVEHWSKSRQDKFQLVEFSLWLRKKADITSQLIIPKQIDSLDRMSRYKGKNEVTLATTITNGCNCCKNEKYHPLSFCPKFKTFTTKERWEFVMAHKMCFSCLLPHHNVKQCKKRNICDIPNCQKFHHKLLHNENVVPNKVPEGRENVVNFHMSDRTVLLKILPVTIKYRGKSLNTYALLDDASTTTLIDENLANTLGLNGPQKHLRLHWTNEQIQEQDNSRIVSFTIHGLTEKQFILRHVRTVKNLSLLKQTVNVSEICNMYPYLQENKIVPMDEVQPKILIGQDNWPLLTTKRIIRGSWIGPALSQTPLGWVLHGNIDRRNNQRDDTNYIYHVSSDREEEREVEFPKPEIKLTAPPSLNLNQLQNTTNEATKRNGSIDFSDENLWINGPRFLHEEKTQWPQETTSLQNKEESEEISNEHTLTIGSINSETEEVTPDPSIFSKWSRLLRSTAWILRFVSKIKKKITEVDNASQVENDGESQIILESKHHFLNSRPLSHISLDSTDSEPHTPNHFLIGTHYTALPYTSDNNDLYSKWRAAQRFADLFGQRWSNEYLPTLIRRTKWYQEKRNIKVGDVVVMVDPMEFRNNWLKGWYRFIQIREDKYVKWMSEQQRQF